MSQKVSGNDKNFYEFEGIVCSRIRNDERQFLIKWKGYLEPTWEPESNASLKSIIDNYYEMKNGTFQNIPVVFNRSWQNPVSIHLEDNRPKIFVAGKSISNFKNLPMDIKISILEQLQTFFYLSDELEE